MEFRRTFGILFLELRINKYYFEVISLLAVKFINN